MDEILSNRNGSPEPPDSRNHDHELWMIWGIIIFWACLFAALVLVPAFTEWFMGWWVL